MRRLLGLVLLLAISLSLVGCSRSADESEKGRTIQKGRIPPPPGGQKG